MDAAMDVAADYARALAALPLHQLLAGAAVLVVAALFALYLLLHLVAPKPRAVLPSEKTYETTTPGGGTVTRQLPCWHDRWLAERRRSEQEADARRRRGDPGNAATGGGSSSSNITADAGAIEPAEVLMSVVIPAYNEAERILPALDEAVDYLDATYGRPRTAATAAAGPEAETPGGAAEKNDLQSFSSSSSSSFSSSASDDTDSGGAAARRRRRRRQRPSGYEILVVDDGSRDGTAEVVLGFAARRGLHDVVRVVRLARNRGKGGSVTHGLRHARGRHALFADADGASRFRDLARLAAGCAGVEDGARRGVAIGSRGHLVGSAAVVRRSFLRNLLMRCFHLVLTILTPPATSRVRDTQCGFKLFSRAALPHIVPYMHAEGWIFDIEMLMLAESAPAVPVRPRGRGRHHHHHHHRQQQQQHLRAEGGKKGKKSRSKSKNKGAPTVNDGGAADPAAADTAFFGSSPGIKVAEVPIDWHEVGGSKLNVIQDSIRMAVGLAVLRASWMLGVYRRRLT